MPPRTSNVSGFTLLDELPDLSYEASDGSSGTLHEYFRGAWGVLFSHPDDFTPICTTEIAELARLEQADEFKSRNTRLMGLSCNDAESHQRWIKDIEAYSNSSVNFPVIADPLRIIASRLGMLSQDDMDKDSLPLTVRTLFVLDPQVRIRLMLTYPASTGRNMCELLRVIDSLQLTSAHPVATPVNWKKGTPVCIAANLSNEEIEKTFQDIVIENLPSNKEYLRFTSDL
ncbi:TPA: hypothetical protein N0F65_009269 [Lagenidium giganteum]|uniref:Thioredoxin domain-containing protein n=1 Tax=Lagenidium giganteum TaxID=4803 RepID=A0AAV2YRL1_9STRA|nr:TPA: hypothetical protein N0F65_009269 [Lagenidium giganteum]